MEWNPVLEDRLKRSKQSAGWRWIGYIGVVLGMLAAGAGWAFYADEKATCEEEAGPFGECEGPSVWLYVGPGVAFFALGLFTALPAEKAAKEAKELTIQKAAAQQTPTSPAGPPTGGMPAPAAPTSPCAACGASLPIAGRFCSECGAPAS